MHFSQRECLVEVKFERNEKMEGATVTGFENSVSKLRYTLVRIKWGKVRVMSGIWGI